MNRLGSESSPYLRQHASDPIDWFPWCDEAFDEARRRNVPVMVSIGYASCHWCHVMAVGTFADPDVGRALGDDYVAVKVDREEHPEIDEIYMAALVALTGRGGWPMTMMLDADRQPFWGGTYYDRDSFLGLLAAVRTVWTERRDEVIANTHTIIDALVAASVQPLADLPGPEIINDCLLPLARGFDRTNGGFGTTPKFAHPMGLDLVMRAHMINPGPGTTEVISISLDAMAAGGLRDHIGGGFARYSTDDRWLVPHFEKMLYDQAMMIGIYRRGWSLFGRPAWRSVVEETVSHLLDRFRLPGGALASSFDADSTNPSGRLVEGWWMTWTPAEVAAVVGSEADDVCAWFGITDEGHLDGRSVPNRLHDRDNLMLTDTMAAARQALLTARNDRPQPAIDDKVITEWNALAVSALADAGMVMGRDDWVAAAVDVAEFLIEHLSEEARGWKRVWHVDGTPQARHRATAADLAALVDAFTRLGEATGRAIWTERAVDVADQLLDLHWDASDGGLFTVGIDSPEPIVMRKDLRDDTTPSANSLAAGALLRLSAIVDEPRYANHADRILQLIGAAAVGNPTSVAYGLGVLESRHRGLTEVVIPGDSMHLVRTAMEIWRPDVVLAWGEATSSTLWTGREAGKAYVCRDRTCAAPVTTAHELAEQLLGRSIGPASVSPDRDA